MTTYTITAMYLSRNRVLTSVDAALSPWTTYLGQTLFAILSSSSGQSVSVDMNLILTRVSLPDPTATYTDVINTFFTTGSIGDVQANYFPQIDGVSGKYENRVQVIDVKSEEGWVVDLINMDYPNTTPSLDRIGAIDDLAITPPSTVNVNDVLIAINGILHKTYIVGGVIWVQDGFSTIKQCAEYIITGIITNGVGGHTVTPITSDMCKIQTSGTTKRVVIHSPELSLLSGTTLLSMDGYLQVLNETYTIRDDLSLIINVNKLDYINNFIYSPIQRFKRDAMSLTSAEYSWMNGKSTVTIYQGTYNRDRVDEDLYSFANSPTVSADTLTSDNFLMDRLTSAHSFIITLKNGNIFRRDYTLINRGEPTVFENFGDDTPRGILLYGNGLVLPYNVLSNPHLNQHLIYVNTVPYYDQLYKTGMNDPTYPAPWTDISATPAKQRAHLIELYTGSLT